MIPVLSICAVVLCGGAAGAIITFVANIRIRFWSRYFELEKLVFDNPFLFYLWDHTGLTEDKNPQDWIGEVIRDNPDNLAKAAMFLEMWGDAILESNRFVVKRLILRNYDIVLTARAKEVAVALNVFHIEDESGLYYSEKSLRLLGFSNADDSSSGNPSTESA